MSKSKLFFVAALLLSGCLAVNAGNMCYYQAEVHAVGHGKIYADGYSCPSESLVITGDSFYQTTCSALFSSMSGSEGATTVDQCLHVYVLPDAAEYTPVGTKFGSLESEIVDLYSDDTCYTYVDEVGYPIRVIATQPQTHAKDTTFGSVYVIFKVKPELVQAACDSVDSYVASKTEIISEELRLIIEGGKENISKNDDDLDNMNAALSAAIAEIDKFFSAALSDVRSKNAKKIKHMANGQLVINVNGCRYGALGQKVK